MEKTIRQQIKIHIENKRFCRIKRQVGQNTFEYNNGYLVADSEDFVLMQESENFKVLGYLVFQISSIVAIRFNNNDRYYDKIMKWENQIVHVKNNEKINITNWKSIFKTIKKSGFNVIVENEDPNDKTFDIGPIIKISNNAVFIQYFDAKGILENELTKIPFDKITITQFDNDYISVFSKYLRKKENH